MHSGELTDLSSERPGLERDVEREMREEWDARAHENAFHYIDDSKDEWRRGGVFRLRRRIGPPIDPERHGQYLSGDALNRNARPGDRLRRRAYDPSPG